MYYSQKIEYYSVLNINELPNNKTKKRFKWMSLGDRCSSENIKQCDSGNMTFGEYKTIDKKTIWVVSNIYGKWRYEETELSLSLREWNYCVLIEKC